MPAPSNSAQSRLTRRAFCRQALAGTACGIVATGRKRRAQVGSETKEGFVPSEVQEMEATALAFMQKHHVPGMSVANAKEGRLVYARGFGLADKSCDEQVTPNHLFRIASLSKPVTATTIFRLIERERLRLSDKIFGTNGVLGT